MPADPRGDFGRRHHQGGSPLRLVEPQVAEILRGQDAAVGHVVRRAYELHHAGDTVVPPAAFLPVPGGGRSRMIALPAYLGGEFRLAGVKWITSFPRNHARGLARASGIVILSSPATGAPLAILDGATISAQRTAASADLATGLLWGDRPPPARVAVVGCGPISLAIVRLLARRWPRLAEIVAYDVVPARGATFRACCPATTEPRVVSVASLGDLLARGAEVLVLATTAITPHIESLGTRPPRLVLHVSLRDLAPTLVARCRNVVDDVTHVCRHATSVHLAAERLGHRRFIDATVGELLGGRHLGDVGEAPIVFSPFGLGILDVAVAALVYGRAHALDPGAREPGVHVALPTAAGEA